MIGPGHALVGTGYVLVGPGLDMEHRDHWWDSKIIPRFTKTFEYWTNFKVIVIGIRNNAFTRNLSPWAFSRAEKSHRTFRNLRMGQVPLKITFFEYCWYHPDERSKEHFFTQDHEKRVTNSSVFRPL